MYFEVRSCICPICAKTSDLHWAVLVALSEQENCSGLEIPVPATERSAVPKSCRFDSVHVVSFCIRMPPWLRPAAVGLACVLGGGEGYSRKSDWRIAGTTTVSWAISNIRDSHEPDTLVYPTGTSPCTHAVEPPCTGR